MKFIWIDVRGAFGLLLPMVSAIFSDNELASPALTGDVIFEPLQLKIKYWELSRQIKTPHILHYTDTSKKLIIYLIIFTSNIAW